MEDMIVEMAINLLRGIIRNPTFQAKFQSQLLEVAADIQTAFGLTPPTK